MGIWAYHCARDIIKEFVDKEIDLDKCLDMVKGMEGKIISRGDSKSSTSSSVSVSLSQKYKTDADVFTEMIIDDLKRENRDLKFALVTRNQRLEDAALKVTQLVEQNTYLTQKVEKTAFEHANQARELIETQKRY